MKYLRVKAELVLSLLILFSGVSIAGFSFSGSLRDCPVVRQPHFFSNTKLHQDFTQYDRTYDCCNKIPSNKFSKTEYIINFNEELNLKLSSKRFHVLQHSIIESFKNSSFTKHNYRISEHTIESLDIPVITSSLLI